MKAIFGILTALLLTPALASAQDTASQPAAPSAQQAASMLLALHAPTNHD